MRRGLIVLALAVWVGVGGALAGDPPWLARGTGGMVASDSAAASQIGADVLKAGGNAFDAAVAVSFALTVARPQSTGLGGGGFMVAYVAEQKQFVALDFREVAPKSATIDRYTRLHAERGKGPSPSVYGGNAVAVPGQLAGLAEINRRFGTRPLAELIRPAATLAQVGFAVDAHFHNACKNALEDYDKWPTLKYTCKPLYDTLLNNGQPPAVGTRIKRPDLAQALLLIAERGPDVFCNGSIGRAIVDAVNKAGGSMTPADLRGYRISERQPLRVDMGGYELVLMPPPSSGGVCLAEALNVLHNQAADFKGGVKALRNDDLFAPMLVYSLKHAFADRARWLGDPDFSDIPVARLISREYAEELCTPTARESDEFGSTNIPDDGGTSHFCVADRFGNVVTLTETINGEFGSLVVAEPFGIILNNEMDDFATNPGKANMFGLVQGQANVVAPGKRPLSSMSPTIVLKDGRPVLTLGASGGPRIITAVMQVMLNVVEFDLPLEEAMSAVRLHHQWQPDEVYFDRDPPQNLVAALEHAGQTISGKRKGAAVQAIQILSDGEMVGASDPSKGGRPVGLP